MNRRSFLKGMLGAVAAMALPPVAKPLSTKPAAGLSSLMNGEIGHIDGGVKFVETPQSITEIWSEKLFQENYDRMKYDAIIADNGFGVGVIARPHMIKIQRDMNGLMRSFVIGDA